jgi:hypothetical protein
MTGSLGWLGPVDPLFPPCGKFGNHIEFKLGHFVQNRVVLIFFVVVVEQET